MNLSRNFTLEELTRTATGLPNEPGGGVQQSLLCLANYILQPIRDEWGLVRVTSGYRSSAVNLRVGGSPESEHMTGAAADFIPIGSDMAVVFDWIVTESRIPFGQCILETKDGRDWIHISLVRFDRPNQEALSFDGSGYKPYSV